MYMVHGKVIRKIYDFFYILNVTEERSQLRSWIPAGSISQRYGSGDPDPYQNVTDPQHCRQHAADFRQRYQVVAGLRICITLMRIRIKLIILSWIRIQLFTLMRIRIKLFTLLRIRIQLFTLMRIRIQLFTLLWIRIRILLLIKVMGICDIDRPSWAPF